MWSIKPNCNHHAQLFAMVSSIRRYWKLRESFICIMQPIIRLIICSTTSLFALHSIWRKRYLLPCLLLIVKSHPSFRIILLWSYIVKYSLNENFTILYDISLVETMCFKFEISLGIFVFFIIFQFPSFQLIFSTMIFPTS